ncbi:Spo0E family sporulation regulatory protein-aspartic acid phosphatase [Neobacillus sp. D3-1R]|uniref:Spo0E family sporulation regulatory protein-aspartic acid phosphatase n=1 Tax=Neobacillus sp. D3-1R TaxID=3445778 RepID=UPI003FA10B96
MLNQLIERTRIQMFEEARVNGFTGTKTVQISQDLDRLLNWFQNKYINQTNRIIDDFQVHGSIIQNINSGLQYNGLNHELLEKDTSHWHSLNDIYQVLLKLEEEYDEGLIRDIGKFVPENSLFPGEIDSFEKGLLTLDMAYKLNHSDGIEGYYQVYFQGRREIYVICNTLYYSASFNEGIIKGLAEKFNLPIQITVMDHRMGGEFKISLLSTY